MGNSNYGPLRAAIQADDSSGLQKLLEDDSAHAQLGQSLNRRGDTALILAARHSSTSAMQVLLSAGCEINQVNHEGETALDVVLGAALPADGDLLHLHSCPLLQTQQHRQTFTLPHQARILLEKGGHGRQLEKLILHVMKEPQLISEIIDLLKDLDDIQYYRLSGLLLQVVVWFNHEDNLIKLLNQGIAQVNYWRASFMPQIQPSNCHSSVPWPRGEGGEYILRQQGEEHNGIQSLKFYLVQDWQADWNDGENPEAQYRAGLQLPPETAVIFVRAANNMSILRNVMNEVTSYIPATCSGPNLKDSCLIQCLISAGYIFTEEEIRHLHLKFEIDFSTYQELLNQPKPLRQICRICVRKSFIKNVFYALNHLDGLPAVIRRYLMLHDS